MLARNIAASLVNFNGAKDILFPQFENVRCIIDNVSISMKENMKDFSQTISAFCPCQVTFCLPCSVHSLLETVMLCVPLINSSSKSEPSVIKAGSLEMR